jgi:hypothetical protein
MASHWDRWAAMIDDFQVPDDEGYGFGQYHGTNLTIDLLAGPMGTHGVVPYFPAAPGRDKATAGLRRTDARADPRRREDVASSTSSQVTPAFVR